MVYCELIFIGMKIFFIPWHENLTVINTALQIQILDNKNGIFLFKKCIVKDSTGGWAKMSKSC